MRVLVTGGAGYIGSHVAWELHRRGHTAIVYDNLSTGHRVLAAGFEFIAGDISDAGLLATVLPQVDAVMHFAGSIEVGESVRNPRKYFANNLQNGLALLNAVVDAKIRHFLFSSTCAVYGMPEKSLITEDAPRKPVNPYGASKLAFEMALEAYSDAGGPQSVSLRYFNAAGADESGEIGEMHQPETHLIPLVLDVALEKGAAVTIFGSDYPTLDGTCIRDFIHVQDLATAHVLALEYLASGGKSTALNLGTGRGYSVLEVIAEAERVTGRILPRQLLPRRQGDPPILVADSSRAHALLGWRPTRSLNEILVSAWNWARRQHETSAGAT